jgi:hypothetical protein
MLETKDFWKSKAFWLGVFIAAGGIVELIYGLPAGASVPTIIGGVISIIVRVFFTTEPITGTPGAKARK